MEDVIRKRSKDMDRGGRRPRVAGEGACAEVRRGLSCCPGDRGASRETEGAVSFGRREGPKDDAGTLSDVDPLCEVATESVRFGAAWLNLLDVDAHGGENEAPDVGQLVRGRRGE
eukprot:7947132-Heterocapsa_arctica.AAC.1